MVYAGLQTEKLYSEWKNPWRTLYMQINRALVTSLRWGGVSARKDTKEHPSNHACSPCCNLDEDIYHQTMKQPWGVTQLNLLIWINFCDFLLITIRVPSILHPHFASSICNLSLFVYVLPCKYGDMVYSEDLNTFLTNGMRAFLQSYDILSRPHFSSQLHH